MSPNAPFSPTRVAICIILFMVFVFARATPVPAKIVEGCCNCHTMHNSQRGLPTAFDGTQTTNPALTRGTCKGCHAQRKPEYVIQLGGGTIRIPQVYHTNATYDLAGGNFGYIDGIKGSGASSTKGHNVLAAISALTGETLAKPPGADQETGIITTNFTCAGRYGCHGDRTNTTSEGAAMKGAHHGKGDTIDGATVGTSYRFLKGVKGVINDDLVHGWQNYSATYCNKYQGANVPDSDVTMTSPGTNGTISGFCSECHGKFHHGTGDSGQGTGSPWRRHPTDTLLPNSGAYSAYDPTASYDSTVPVAYIDPSNPTRVTAVVMCLSCHAAHATNYYAMLRWDYSKMIAGHGGEYSGTGCFKCHSDKD